MENKNSLMRFIIWKILPNILKPYLGKVHGLQNLPKKGPYLVAINHSSSIDPAIVAYVLWTFKKQKLRFLGKKQHFDSLIGNSFQKAAGTIPIDRTTSANKLTQKGFEIALKELSRVHQGRTGVARLALWAKVPVVPITLVGAFRVWRKGRLLPRLPIGKKGKVEVVIGKPLYFNRYYKAGNLKLNNNNAKSAKKLSKTWRTITDYIMKQIARHGKLKYVDEKTELSEFVQKIQKPKMKELWDNKHDEHWKDA